MRFSDLFNVSAEEIYWSLKFGLPKKKGVIYDLRKEGFNNIDRPVFFLSTGRCGTNWFAHLLAKDKKLKVFHEPQPNLGSQGKAVYEIYRKNAFDLSNDEKDLVQEIFLAGREEYLRYSFKTQKRYIETNNHITFFAPAIYDLLPSALFIHIFRHPGEFVRSAMRRRFYSKGNKENLKRIIPPEKTEAAVSWSDYDLVQKNAWLWNETNSFIEDFKDTIPEDRVFTFNFNELTEENVMDLAKFVGAQIAPGKLSKALGRRSNIQKRGSFKSYGDWKTEDKDKLLQICGNLANKYGYKL
jgi:hypothetical protein